MLSHIRYGNMFHKMQVVSDQMWAAPGPKNVSQGVRGGGALLCIALSPLERLAGWVPRSKAKGGRRAGKGSEGQEGK